MCSNVPPIPGGAMYAADPARTLMVRDRTGRAPRVCGMSVWQPLGFRAVELADRLHALQHQWHAATNAWRTACKHNPDAVEHWRTRIIDLHARIQEWSP